MDLEAFKNAISQVNEILNDNTFFLFVIDSEEHKAGEAAYNTGGYYSKGMTDAEAAVILYNIVEKYPKAMHLYLELKVREMDSGFKAGNIINLPNSPEN